MSDFERAPKVEGAGEDVEIHLFADHVEGLMALYHWCDAFGKSGNGRVPGAFELVMHIRELKAALQRKRERV